MHIDTCHVDERFKMQMNGFSQNLFSEAYAYLNSNEDYRKMRGGNLEPRLSLNEGDPKIGDSTLHNLYPNAYEGVQ